MGVDKDIFRLANRLETLPMCWNGDPDPQSAVITGVVDHNHNFLIATLT